MEDTKNEMRKKISFSKAYKKIEDCEHELIESGKEIGSARVSALRAVMDSNWKKIDKYLPNAAMDKNNQEGNVLVIVNREGAVVQKNDEAQVIEHE